MRISDWSSDVCSSDLCRTADTGNASTNLKSQHPDVHHCVHCDGISVGTWAHYALINRKKRSHLTVDPDTVDICVEASQPAKKYFESLDVVGIVARQTARCAAASMQHEIEPAYCRVNIELG